MTQVYIDQRDIEREEKTQHGYPQRCVTYLYVNSIRCH